MQAKVEEESRIKDTIRTYTETLHSRNKTLYSVVTYIHFSPDASLKTAVLDPLDALLQQQAKTIQELAAFVAPYPFYKFYGLWSREIGDTIRSLQVANWLKTQALLSPQEVGSVLGVKATITEEDGDVFHITVENYLFGLIDATEELSRLVQNSVIIGDWWRPAQLSKLVRDVHQAFQILNLKNDGLRRKVDGIKYSVKRVEEVMYDLKLRGLNQEKPGAGDVGKENDESTAKKAKNEEEVVMKD